MYLFGVKYCYNLVRLQIACCHLVFGKKSPSFQNVDIFPELATESVTLKLISIYVLGLQCEPMRVGALDHDRLL